MFSKEGKRVILGILLNNFRIVRIEKILKVLKSKEFKIKIVLDFLLVKIKKGKL